MMTSKRFHEIVTGFDDIVLSTEIVDERTKGDMQLFKAKILFRHSSRLAMTDHFSELRQKRKYSYQWMQADNSLIIRWDNSHYHDEVPTAPHHKHVGENGKAEASDEMDLREVLLFVRNAIVND